MIAEHCPDIDMVGINSYEGVLSIPERYAATGLNRPYLMTEYAMNGEYPRTLSLEDIERGDPYNGRELRRSLSAIEGYRTGREGVSFVAVSADGKHRVQVRDGFIESGR